MRHTALALILCSVWSAPFAATSSQGQPEQAVTHIQIGPHGTVNETSSVAGKAAPTPQATAHKAVATVAQAPDRPSPAQPRAVAAPKNPAMIPVPAAPAPIQDGVNQPLKGSSAMAASLYGSGGGIQQVSGPGIPPTGGKRGVLAQTLPGVGEMPGDSPALQNNVIRVSSDRTSIVNVSGTLTNRISTPFQKPKAILLDGSASVKAVGQSLYVAPNGDPSPISLYVTGSGTNDPVVSLTLVPKSVPPQTIVLQMDGPASASNAGGEAAGEDRPVSANDSYTKQVISTLRSLALGRVPQGYAEGALPRSVANLGNVVAIPLARYSGPIFDVYRYRIEAIVDGTMEMQESAFWTKGVRAVSLYPSGVVSKGHPTQVFVIADKTATGGAR